MMDDRDWAMIRKEIALQVMIITHGQTASTQIDDSPSTESIDNCPPGMPTITGRPVMHPYGLASRALKETISVIARVGNHPANKIIIGHRDKDRPALEADGDVVLYDGHGNVMMLKNEDPYIDTGDRAFSVGGKDLPDSLLGAIALAVKTEMQKITAKMDANTSAFNTHTHPSGMGPTGTPVGAMTNADNVEDMNCDHVRLG